MFTSCEDLDIKFVSTIDVFNLHRKSTIWMSNIILIYYVIKSYIFILIIFLCIYFPINRVNCNLGFGCCSSIRFLTDRSISKQPSHLFLPRIIATTRGISIKPLFLATVYQRPLGGQCLRDHTDSRINLRDTGRSDVKHFLIIFRQT